MVYLKVPIFFTKDENAMGKSIEYSRINKASSYWKIFCMEKQQIPYKAYKYPKNKHQILVFKIEILPKFRSKPQKCI